MADKHRFTATQWSETLWLALASILVVFSLVIPSVDLSYFNKIFLGVTSAVLGFRVFIKSFKTGCIGSVVMGGGVFLMFLGAANASLHGVLMPVLISTMMFSSKSFFKISLQKKNIFPFLYLLLFVCSTLLEL